MQKKIAAILMGVVFFLPVSAETRCTFHPNMLVEYTFDECLSKCRTSGCTKKGFCEGQCSHWTPIKDPKKNRCYVGCRLERVADISCRKKCGIPKGPPKKWSDSQ